LITLGSAAGALHEEAGRPTRDAVPVFLEEELG
jgi:hypothetical protein